MGKGTSLPEGHGASTWSWWVLSAAPAGLWPGQGGGTRVPRSAEACGDLGERRVGSLWFRRSGQGAAPRGRCGHGLRRGSRAWQAGLEPLSMLGGQGEQLLSFLSNKQGSTGLTLWTVTFSGLKLLVLRISSDCCWLWTGAPHTSGWGEGRCCPHGHPVIPSLCVCPQSTHVSIPESSELPTLLPCASMAPGSRPTLTRGHQPECLLQSPAD